MNSGSVRKLPDDAPVDFIRERWSKLIFTDAGVDRRYYELCALSELKNALRSGDIWVEGSRQFNNFNEYLLPEQKFATLKGANGLPLAVDPDCERYLQSRLETLHEQLERVNQIGRRKRSSGCDPDRLGVEDHSPRRDGAACGAGSHRSNCGITATHQDHRAAP